MIFSDSSSICLSLTSYSALYSWKHVRPRFILGRCVVCLGKVHHDNCGESAKPGRSRWGLPSFALAKAATLWAMASSKPSRSMLLSSVRGKTGKPWETGLQPENHGKPWMYLQYYILITTLEQFLVLPGKACLSIHVIVLATRRAPLSKTSQLQQETQVCWTMEWNHREQSECEGLWMINDGLIDD